ncbi:hypothetical protein ScPMuIL_005679 [Solemya velum]
MANKKAVGKVICDALFLSCVAFPILIFAQVVQPYKRGFYCNDQSLMHPFKESTIPSWVAGVVGVFLPIVVMIIVEGVHFSVCRPKMGKTTNNRAFVHILYRTIGIFVFGASVSQLTTDITKYSVGRLRPHYLTICNPNVSCTDPNDYIEEDVCQGTDLAKLKEARLSFPSGHASLSFYCMVYLIIYLQVRFSWVRFTLLKPVLQLLAFYLAYYTALSRVSDYKHHWSDVLAGSLLGAGVSFIIAFHVSDLFVQRGRYMAGGDGQIIPMFNALPKRENSMNHSHTETSSNVGDHTLVAVPEKM